MITKKFIEQVSKLEDNVLIFNLDLLNKKVIEIKQIFAGISNCDLYFAVKANSNQRLLRYLHNLGLGFDVASTEELGLVSDFENTRVSCTSPSFTEEKIANIIRLNFVNFDCDNLHQLNCYLSHSQENSIGIRFKSSFISNSRFGISINDLKKHPIFCDLSISRLHLHWEDKTNLADSLDEILEIVKLNKKQFYNLETVNLGGGWSNLYYSKNLLDSVEHINKFQHLLSERLNKNIKIIIEPGDLLVNQCGFLKSNIISINDDQLIVNFSGFNLFPWNKIPCGPALNNFSVIKDNSVIKLIGIS